MSLNIGGGEDEFFRYKMPDIQVKIEGRGNGIKTCIPNMSEIGTALKCDPGYPTKYFATELGAVSQWDEKRNVGIVNGAHDKVILAKLLADFIDKYILCPNCKLPETKLKVKKGKIYYQCGACGAYGLSDNTHKLATYILKHPPNKGADSKSKGDKKAEKKAARRAKKDKVKRQDSKTENDDDEDGSEEADEQNGDSNKEEEEDGEINFEITEEMKNMKFDENAQIDDPVKVLQEALDAADTTEAKVEAARKYQKERGFDDNDLCTYVFKVVVQSRMAREVKANINLLKQVTPSGHSGQTLLLALIEQRCEEYSTNLKKVPATLMALYEADLVEEDTFITWFEKGSLAIVALADPAVGQKTRKAAEEFIKWLQEAEEESEEE